MGIGLSVSHKIIMAHNGRLWAEPNPSGGTIFHLTLPVLSGLSQPQPLALRQGG